MFDIFISAIFVSSTNNTSEVKWNLVSVKIKGAEHSGRTV
jgi:hypothetical protein